MLDILITFYHFFLSFKLALVIKFYFFRSIMSDVIHDHRVLSLGNRAGLRQSLTTLLDQLGRCQKALNEFLEVH